MYNNIMNINSLIINDNIIYIDIDFALFCDIALILKALSVFFVCLFIYYLFWYLW